MTRAVPALARDRDVVGADRPVAIPVTVTNTGDAASPPRSVELLLNGMRLTAEKLTGLKPGGGRTVQFTHQFDAPGSVVLGAASVSILSSTCPLDSTRWSTMR